jgi:glucose-6-phosphate isomerase
MSVIRPKLPEDPLHYDPAGLEAAAGLPAGGLARWAEPLEPLRDRVLAAPGPGLPDRLLADYTTPGDGTGTTGRAASELFAILGAARRVREAVDRVIIGGGGTAAARAIVDACCHPCHNELSRGERGGRPRLSFAPMPGDSGCGRRPWWRVWHRRPWRIGPPRIVF